jgi:hypothetical protein
LAYESRSDFENRFHFKAVQLKWGKRAAIHLLRRKFGKRARYWDENVMREFLALGV